MQACKTATFDKMAHDVYLAVLINNKKYFFNFNEIFWTALLRTADKMCLSIMSQTTQS